MPETAVAVRELTLGEAVREALAEEMRRDPRVFIMGEDVAEAGTAFKGVAVARDGRLAAFVNLNEIVRSATAWDRRVFRVRQRVIGWLGGYNGKAAA